MVKTMKIPESAKTPTFICILITCVVSFLSACVLFALTISHGMAEEPSFILTVSVFLLFAVVIVSIIIILLLIIRQIRITEKETMDRLNMLKVMFFQDISHDFKTPLTVISVNILDSAHMLDYEINIQELKENLANAQSEIMRMSRMVDSTINDATEQKTLYEMESLNIVKILQGGTEPYRSLLKQNGNTLTLDIPKTLPKIFGNEDMLLLVMGNLLSNATRYTKNGQITISAKNENKHIIVSVSDNGTGIDPKIMSSIFKRGVSDGGTGFGLPICKNIIEAHKGKINIVSTLNEGTTVYFSIPVKEITVYDR